MTSKICIIASATSFKQIIKIVKLAILNILEKKKKIDYLSYNCTILLKAFTIVYRKTFNMNYILKFVATT